ncbi:MAG: hypothetical protein M1820_007771 [Bogoriella megaspora]|nr:MAG: hypothetical protein M1820_007771 [Bogoriella megaspora]
MAAVWYIFLVFLITSIQDPHNSIPAGVESAKYWKERYASRRASNRVVSNQLELIISRQRGRIQATEPIVRFGFDAKDVLLRNLDIPDSAEDVLARRYWSLATLNSIQRWKGIGVWMSIASGNRVSLEEALGAFDMFVLDDRFGDIQHISARLDRLAGECSSDLPEFENLTMRQKAVEICRFVRARDIVGIDSNDDYHILRNRFIGLALFDSEHQALPIVSVAIYCCLAQRLGVNANPCNFPFHVHAVIQGNELHRNLDGKPVEPNENDDRMFLDPFSNDDEVSESRLRDLLNQSGVRDHEQYLGASPIAETILRSARNIANSVQNSETNDPPRRSPLSSYHSGLPDTDSAFYGALWAMILFDPIRRRTYLHHIVSYFQQGFEVDVGLIEKFILPTFEDFPEHPKLIELASLIRRWDETAKPITVRGPNARNVKYRVGQVFRHRRYEYEAMIVGWDDRCQESEDWIIQMNVDSLPRGREQSFYHVVVSDKSTRYVAEENIRIDTGHPSRRLMTLAGRYFKRWDQEKGAFISNVRDEYPDD